MPRVHIPIRIQDTGGVRVVSAVVGIRGIDGLLHVGLRDLEFGCAELGTGQGLGQGMV